MELEGILIIAIYRKVAGKKQLVGAPHGEVIIKAGDELICYAKEEAINNIFSQKYKGCQKR